MNARFPRMHHTTPALPSRFSVPDVVHPAVCKAPQQEHCISYLFPEVFQIFCPELLCNNPTSVSHSLTEMFFEHSEKLVLFQYILDHNICSDPEGAAPINFRAFLRHRRVGKDVRQKTFHLGTSFPDGLDQVFRCWPAQGSCISFPSNTCDRFRTECMWDFLFSSG